MVTIPHHSSSFLTIPQFYIYQLNPKYRVRLPWTHDLFFFKEIFFKGTQKKILHKKKITGTKKNLHTKFFFYPEAQKYVETVLNVVIEYIVSVIYRLYIATSNFSQNRRYLRWWILLMTFRRWNCDRVCAFVVCNIANDSVNHLSHIYDQV